jgi:hypothetical protein
MIPQSKTPSFLSNSERSKLGRRVAKQDRRHASSSTDTITSALSHKAVEYAAECKTQSARDSDCSKTVKLADSLKAKLDADHAASEEKIRRLTAEMRAIAVTRQRDTKILPLKCSNDTCSEQGFMSARYKPTHWKYVHDPDNLGTCLYCQAHLVFDADFKGIPLYKCPACKDEAPVLTMKNVTTSRITWKHYSMEELARATVELTDPALSLKYHCQLCNSPGCVFSGVVSARMIKDHMGLSTQKKSRPALSQSASTASAGAVDGQTAAAAAAANIFVPPCSSGIDPYAITGDKTTLNEKFCVLLADLKDELNKQPSYDELHMALDDAMAQIYGLKPCY